MTTHPTSHFSEEIKFLSFYSNAHPNEYLRQSLKTLKYDKDWSKILTNITHRYRVMYLVKDTHGNLPHYTFSCGNQPNRFKSTYKDYFPNLFDIIQIESRNLHRPVKYYFKDLNSRDL